MNSFYKIVYGLILGLIIVFSTPVVVQAQESADKTVSQFQIAVLNMKAVLQKSSAVKNIHEQINKYRSGFHREIQNEEDQLRKARQELSRQRNILSPEAYAEETKKFEARVAEVQHIVQLRRQDLGQARNKAMAEVQVFLNKIISNIAQENGILLVLRREQTVLSSLSLEITDEVVKRLNEELPNITVPQPGN